MDRLLITGSGGFLGQELCRYAVKSWRVLGISRTSDSGVAGAENLRLNLRDSREIQAALDRVRPDAVIHAAAMADPNACEDHVAESQQINVDASIRIATWCASNRVPLVFISSDLVFDGTHAPYRETDPVSPLNEYGRQKAQAECRILEIFPEAAVCRLSLMYGSSGSGRQKPLADVLLSGQPVRLFTDEFRTPLYVRDAVTGIFQVLGRASGIVHLGGGERLSRYDFGRMLAEILGVPDYLVSPCRQKDILMKAARPRDVSLDISKAAGLGFRLLPPREILACLYGRDPVGYFRQAKPGQ